MARSTFYYHISRMKDPDKYAVARSLVAKVYRDHKGRYGYRRITYELRNNYSIQLNHKTVKKLMDELGLKAKAKKVRYRSYRGEVGTTAPNIVNRNFRCDRPFRKAATDVSQITIGGEKIYLSAVQDMFNGEILAYSLSDTPNLKMVMDMLHVMYKTIKYPEGMTLHSDQGWHYQHRAYRKSLERHSIIQSMSRKGNCLDNAMMENFFGAMKKELLYRTKYDSMSAFKKDLMEYIEYYNNKRIKLRLNGLSPVQYRMARNIQQ